jgi:hypothetical protein
MAKIRCLSRMRCDLGRSRSGWFDFEKCGLAGLWAPSVLGGALTLFGIHGPGSVAVDSRGDESGWMEALEGWFQDCDPINDQRRGSMCQY